MESYLKPRQEYIDRYDHGTVYQCRRLRKTCRETWEELKEKPEIKKSDKDEKELLRTVLAMYRVSLYFMVGDRYMEREETVRKWMEKDERKDRLLAEAPIPHSRCSVCGGTMRCEHKHISPSSVFVHYFFFSGRFFSFGGFFCHSLNASWRSASDSGFLLMRNVQSGQRLQA